MFLFCSSSSDCDESNGNADEDADEEEEDEEGADEEEEEEEVEVDLDLSPEGTWAKASELRKVDWIQKRKWVALMGHVLKDKPRQNWTMKRFLHEMCRIKQIAGYRNNLTAKKCGELLDNVGVVEQSVQTPVSTTGKKVGMYKYIIVYIHVYVILTLFHTPSHTHTHPPDAMGGEDGQCASVVVHVRHARYEEGLPSHQEAVDASRDG